MATRYFCDRCEARFDVDGKLTPVVVGEAVARKELCRHCAEELLAWLRNVSTSRAASPPV